VRCRLLQFSMTLLLVAGAMNGHAEESRREGGEQTARLQAMLQQLDADKTRLSAENTKLKSDLEKAKADVDAAKAEHDTLTGKLGRAGNDLTAAQAKSEALRNAFDTLKSRFDQLVEQYRNTAVAMRGVETERDGLNRSATALQARVATCERNNDALYKTDLELIDLYEHKGVFTSLMQREPVTQIKRVQIENLMDQYRSLGDQMRIEESPVAEDASHAQAKSD